MRNASNIIDKIVIYTYQQEGIVAFLLLGQGYSPIFREGYIKAIVRLVLVRL